jgi:hypothetical protein
VLTYSELVALENGKVDKEAMGNSNASARVRSCSAAPAGARSDLLTLESREARLRDDFKSTESGYS